MLANKVKSVLSEISTSYLKHVLDIHFHPELGTPYWIERQKQLKYKDVNAVNDWYSFKQIVGFQDPEDQKRFERDTRLLSLEQFIPKAILNDRSRSIWASQTGGTTGLPKHGCWDSVYWKNVMNFTNEFLDIFKVPYAANWLFLGPMGPHTTGRLVVDIAQGRGGLCYSIDLDPRFVKIAVNEKMDNTLQRYLKHIWEQTESILKYQKVEVLFATSRLLEMAPEYIDMDLFRGLKGIVHAGTPLDADTNELLQTELFPNIPIIGMYGTSTTGISYQASGMIHKPYRVVYVPSSPYITLEVVNDHGEIVSYESEGFLATYRLTEDYLIPGFWERDKGIRVKPEGDLALQYPWDWVGEIYSYYTKTDKKLDGVY
jgi:thienamycin biosynthesis protein ThnN